MAVNQTRNFIVSLVLARLLMPSDFGLISMALVLNTILDSIVDFGLGNAVIRKEKITETELSTVFWINILLYNPQIEMFARFKMKSSFHKTKRII